VRGTLNEPGSAKVNGSPARILAGNVFEALIQATSGSNTFAVEASDQSGNVTTKNYQVSVIATGATYTYDPNGNLTQKVEGPDTWVYEWNAKNQLKRVLKNSVEQARFAYDAIGRRVEKITSSAVTHYTYERGDILREVQGSTTVKYVHGPGVDEPLAADVASELTCFHVDALGSVTKVTNSTGAVTMARRYDAWGRIEVSASQSGYAFTGREHDAGDCPIVC
jgi:YD repeat-containing protein